MAHLWQSRGPDRLPDAEWDTTLRRVRAEFDEMPGLRVTPQQARVLFGLSDAVLSGVLTRLSDEGYLETRDGQYVRLATHP
ncbi:MAG: hypothetical protein HYU37_18190 [Acidobacteria bacterium]|nr:hypothetical protein [Acidobacteriota bacterium]